MDSTILVVNWHNTYPQNNKKAISTLIFCNRSLAPAVTTVVTNQPQNEGKIILESVLDISAASQTV